MTISVPNGALVAIAAAYGAAVPVTAASNAAEAGLTATAHGVAIGEYFEITSGWSRLTDRILRAGSGTTANLLVAEGFNTSDLTVFPAGGGVGSIRKINSFTQLSQILSSSSSGGEQQFLDYQLLEADSQKRIPTFKNAAGIAFTVADDPTLAGYILASTANDDRKPRAVRVSLPSGSKILYNAYISLNKTPSLTVNEIQSVEVTLSLLAEVVRYAT